jgi:protein required for attachment to host cells
LIGVNAWNGAAAKMARKPIFNREELDMKVRFMLPSLWSGSKNEAEPFRTLHHEIDSLFNNFTSDMPMIGRWPDNANGRLSLRCDVAETDKTLEVTAEMPGVSERQLPNTDVHEGQPPTRELVTDRPSRVQESNSATRHAIEPRTDAHEQRKERFLAQLTSRLERAAENKEFEHLIVVTPAPAMGELRKDFSPLLRQRLYDEFVHDYVHQPNDYIYRHIKDGLPL